MTPIMLEASVQVGIELGGRYILEELLDSGGWGICGAGPTGSSNVPVAVKVMWERLTDPQLARRFQREARIAAAPQHPGITVVYDVGAYGGQPFIVMELLLGRNLATRIQTVLIWSPRTLSCRRSPARQGRPASG